MIDLNDINSLDDETKDLIREHQRFLQILHPSATQTWSLEQPSPFQFVPSVLTDSTTNSVPE